MASLFISYSRKDVDFARKLTEAFKGPALDFWIDWEGIPPTVDWWKEIEKGIEEADIFLFLISPDSCNSKVCKREIEHAAKNGKRLIPVVVRDIKAEQSPTELSALNWIFLREADEFEASFKKLLTAIKTDYVWAQSHRELLVKALEWERSNRENSLLLRGKELQEAESQLATNTSKEPRPTDLQREYVLNSRQASDRQRRNVTGIAIGVVIALAALSIVALIQAGLARSAAATAVANASIAKTERANAITEANARATAQALAEERATIALSRLLAAQAQSNQATGNPLKQEAALLLAIRSMQLFPIIDSALLLQNNPFAYPIRQNTYESGVLSASYSPDGSLLALGCSDGTVRLLDSGTGKEVGRMTHERDVYSVTFSPDGKTIASSSRDSTVRLWNVATRDEVLRLTHLDEVYSAVFTPDGTHLATRSFGAAQVWDLSTGELVFKLPDEADGLISFTPDSSYLLSIENDLLYTWDWLTGTEVSRLTLDEALVPLAFSPDGTYLVEEDRSGLIVREVSTQREVTRLDHSANLVAFHPDGKYLASARFFDHSIRVWELPTGREVALMLYEAGHELTSLAFSPDGTQIVSTDWQGSARFWEIPTRLEVARFTHDNTVMSVSFSQDGQYLLSGSEDGIAKVWEVSTGKEIARLKYDGTRNSLAISPDGRSVIFGDGRNTVRVWNRSTRKEVAQIRHNGSVHAIAVSPDGRYVASASEDHTVRISEMDTGEEIARLIHDGAVTAIAISLDGKYIGSVSDDQTIRVWESLSGKEVARITVDTGVYLVAISPDGRRVASSSRDKLIIWEVATGREVAHISHSVAVKSIAFDPTGDYLVSAVECEQLDVSGFACFRGSARVWEISTGREVARMTHDSDVYPAVFSPDGKYVLSASWDGTLRVWEALTGKELARMTHESQVYSAAFSPDGKYVVSGTFDNTVHVWVWRPDDLIEDACARANRNLTRAEWEQYIGAALSYGPVCPNLPVEPEINSTPSPMP